MSEERLKKYINEAMIPDRLLPENIAAMLKQHPQKCDIHTDGHADIRKDIKHTISYICALAACFAVVCTAVARTPADSKSTCNSLTAQIKTASDYDEIYSYLKKSNNKYNREESGFFNNNHIVYEEKTTVSSAEDVTSDGYEESDSYSSTITQSENVDESDNVKTDGKNIFYTSCNKLYWIDPSDSDLTTYKSYELFEETENNNSFCCTQCPELYLSDNTVTVVYSTPYEDETNINIYQIQDDGLELTDTFSQNGSYSDSRMIGNIIYLITNASSDNYDDISDSSQTDRYIPEYTSDGDSKLIDADNIFLSDDVASSSYLSYAVVSATDITQTQNSSSVSAFAGFDGQIYCTDENLYIANRLDNSDTQLVRLSLDGTSVTPQANAHIPGYVLNQFSMDEYNGYFRIATTKTADSKRSGGFLKSAVNEALSGLSENYYDEINTDDNRLYVLDLDLNTVSELERFGKGERIKSVSFQNDTAFVVTFRQTDPLFTIDLSDPSSPVISDEYKINGFSTFLHDWGNGYLLGFGSDGDNFGNQNGIKATMFRKTDGGTQECDTYRVFSDSDIQYVYSQALNDRKALLIDPDKNIIGFPVTYYDYNDYNCQDTEINKYIYLRFNGESFEELGRLTADSTFLRSIYIGDSIYAFTINGIQKTDINNFDNIRTLSFE